MEFGIVSDVHLRSRKREEILDVLAAISEECQQFDPAFVAVTGDLIQDEDEHTDRRHFASVANAFDDFPCPVHYTLGNHDVPNVDLDAIESIIGHEAQTVVTDYDVPLVFLNTADRDAAPAGRLTDAQLEWLDARLGELDEAVLFTHHPLFRLDVADNPWFADEPELAWVEKPEAALDVIERHGNVRAAFAGHVHESFLEARGETPHHVIPPVSKETPGEIRSSGYFATVECVQGQDPCVGIDAVGDSTQE